MPSVAEAYSLGCNTVPAVGRKGDRLCAGPRTGGLPVDRTKGVVLQGHGRFSWGSDSSRLKGQLSNRLTLGVMWPLK